MKIDRIHHVAYRCKDAKATVEWYVKNLNMEFVLAIAEDLVPSTKAPDPYMHVFLDAGGGNVLASNVTLGSYFEAVARQARTPKTVANWVINNLLAELNGLQSWSTDIGNAYLESYKT